MSNSNSLFSGSKAASKAASKATGSGELQQHEVDDVRRSSSSIHMIDRLPSKILANVKPKSIALEPIKEDDFEITQKMKKVESKAAQPKEVESSSDNGSQRSLSDMSRFSMLKS